MTLYIVTSAPPNPNGDLHIGHLSGPFLGADVLSRHLRQRGHEVRYVGFSDEHSCYVPRRAAEIGATAHETALRFTSRMAETLSLGAMHPDWFTRPLTTPRHAETVQRFFTELWDQGKLEVRELPVFYCPGCERHLYEAEVRGACQFCAEPSDGIYCEACGLPQDTTGLTSPHCTACLQEPEVRTMKRIVFPLETYRQQLLDYYKESQSTAEWRPRLRGYLDTLFARELPDTPISRQAAYGVPVPLDGWEGHILDTWFSGIFGYLAATACLTEAEGRPELWEERWRDSRTRVINFIGFDCSFSHAVLWPALLMAQGELTPPSQVVTNEFYRLEGEKFSTSRGHAIWGGDFLRQVSADALRFHLCLTGPEREQSNFAMKDFAATVEEIIGKGDAWARAVLRLLQTDFDNTVPAVEAGPGPLTGVLAELPDEVATALAAENFSPHRAAAALASAFARAADDLPELDRMSRPTEHGEALDESEEYARRLVLHLRTLALIAVLAAPLMPAWASQIAGCLGIPLDPATRMPRWLGSAEGELVPAGRRVTAPPAPISPAA